MSAYLSEAASGCDLHLHVCLFSIDDDSSDHISDRSDTVRVLQDLAHVTNGRFHWFADKGTFSERIYKLKKKPADCENVVKCQSYASAVYKPHDLILQLLMQNYFLYVELI